MKDRIAVHMVPGEQDREQDMRIALSHDPRFEPLKRDSSIPVDLQFIAAFECEKCPMTNSLKCTNCYDYDKQLSGKYFNVELKLPNDFVQSVLNGHLYNQVLTCREAGQDACIVILGDLGDLAEAVHDASKRRAGKYIRGDELNRAIASNHLRCKSFRKRSFLNGVPVFYKGDDSGFFDSDNQWADILDLAHDYLLDGSMMGFRQRPADNEREIAAASMLFKGIGEKVMQEVFKDYKLSFVPREEYARQLGDIPGIGKVRARQIEERVVMYYG